MSLAEFIAQCEPYFSRGDGMIDQIYQRRLPEGMVRCYLVRDRVAGFGEQLVNALYPAEPGAAANSAPQPGPRLYYPAHTSGLPAAQGQAGARVAGPAVRHHWRREGAIADPVGCRFSLWREGHSGADTYVLCEINVSSVYPFPDDALGPLAAETLAQIQRRR